MKAKNLALAAAAVFGLVGANAAFACSTTAWNGGETGNPTEGRPNETNAVARYSGQCGLKAVASGSFVTDNSPAAETTFRARFYVYTGLASGQAVVYRARDAANADRITVTYDRGAGNFSFAIPGATAQTIAAAPNAWYSIELNWAQAGTMAVTVRGAGATTDSTANLTGGTGGGTIDSAQLGWVTGTGTAGNTGTAREGIVTDAYESRRSTAIGRLCRGDANNDGLRNSGDQITVRNEVFGTALGAGQPDANEDGFVNSGDQIAVRNLVFAGQGNCTSGV